jgi:hypothetical protein
MGSGGPPYFLSMRADQKRVAVSALYDNDKYALPSNNERSPSNYEQVTPRNNQPSIGIGLCLP